MRQGLNMKKVNILEKYKTSVGTIVTTQANQTFEIGQIIEVLGKSYKIKNIIFPTLPNENNIISLVIQ